MLIDYLYFHDRRFVPIHTAEVVAQMARHGARIRVTTSADPTVLGKAFSTPGVRVFNLPGAHVRFVSEILFMIQASAVLLVSCLRQRPDVLYTRNGACSMVACLIGRVLGIPCFVEINDIAEDKLMFSGASRIKLLWVRFYHFVNLALATMVLPVTQAIGRHYQARYRLNPARVQVVPNGVNVKRFSPRPRRKARQKYGLSHDVDVVLALGSLFPWAGMELVVAAAPDILAARPHTVFVIGSGEEPYLTRIKDMVAEAGLGAHFRFDGFILWDDAAWFISMADVCVAPFVFRDIRSGVSSLRVFAYMACGRPVVGSDIPGLGDMLEQAGAGVSVPMEDARALARAVIDLLSDKALCARMGEKARQHVLACHDWDVIVRRLFDLFGRGAARSRQ